MLRYTGIIINVLLDQSATSW